MKIEDLQNVPFSEIFNDPDNMRKLESQYKDVQVIDPEKSMQNFIRANLTADEIQTYQQKQPEPNYIISEIEGKINKLAKEFHEFDAIPEAYQVKDIRQTPIVKSLTAINKLLFDFQELALQEVDASQKSKEYAINIINELSKLDKSIQLSLLEIGVYETNIAVLFKRMMNRNENTVEYEKRWTELRNSLNSHLVEYRTTLAEKDDDKEQFNEFAKDLRKFVLIDGETLKHIIQFKELPPDVRDEKPVWKGSYARAADFAFSTGLKISKWNKCFTHSKGKPLKESHYSAPRQKQNEIEIIMNKHKNIFEKYR